MNYRKIPQISRNFEIKLSGRYESNEIPNYRNKKKYIFTYMYIDIRFACFGSLAFRYFGIGNLYGELASISKNQKKKIRTRKFLKTLELNSALLMLSYHKLTVKLA